MTSETPNSARSSVTVLAIFLGVMLFFMCRGWWLEYWLVMDGQTGTAYVTDIYDGTHGGSFSYTYSVGQRTYTGHSKRNWRDPRYSAVEPGEHCPVYFSASHPWLSLLYPPNSVFTGWPVVLFLLMMEAIALTTIISPKSRWAFNPGSEQRGGPVAPNVRR
jgi:hypothetical protein